VSDFGISAFVDNTLAQCHTFLGTVTYMSPERIDGQPYSFPADIWALGLTLLECATGTYPYDASKGTMELMMSLIEDDCPLPDGPHDNMSEALRDFISRCMHKNPLKRPTAMELLRHPFVLGQDRCSTRDLRAYMRSRVQDKDAQIHDASLIMTHRFYNGVVSSAATGTSTSAGTSASSAGAASHAHLTSSFFDVGVTLKSSAPPTNSSPTNSPSQLVYTGQYTVAAHFHDMFRQIGSNACFVLTLRRMKYKVKEGSTDGTLLVNILQRVRLFDSPTSKAKRLPVGVYEENLVVEVSNMDDLVPGKGFRFLSIEALWTKPLEFAVGVGGGASGCKTQ